jgi:hypothetical protein
LTDDQIQAWNATGFLHVARFLTGTELDDLRTTIADVESRHDGDRELLQHYEVGDDGSGTVQICRSEHLVEGYPELRRLVTSSRMVAMAAELLGEAAVLYKEKINYKLPGGAGFAPHQDAPAYPFVASHLTCMLAIDDATEENGCLEMVVDRHAEVLPMDDSGCIRADIVAGFDWVSVPIAAGDLLWFHSRAPHRSHPNRSGLRRRALFCTYNARSQGDLREAYYAEKLERFAATPEGDRTRVSLIGDFQGRAPTAEQLRDLRTGRSTSA